MLTGIILRFLMQKRECRLAKRKLCSVMIIMHVSRDMMLSQIAIYLLMSAMKYSLLKFLPVKSKSYISWIIRLMTSRSGEDKKIFAVYVGHPLAVNHICYPFLACTQAESSKKRFSALPCLYNEIKDWTTKFSYIRTVLKFDQQLTLMGNCLRQPGQLRNQLLKPMCVNLNPLIKFS